MDAIIITKENRQALINAELVQVPFIFIPTSEECIRVCIN